MLALCALAALAGCEEEVRIVHDPWMDWANRVGLRRDPLLGESEGLALPEQGYAILVESFRGADAARQALRLMVRLKRDAGLREVWSRPEGDGEAVYVGRYASPAGPRVQEDLKQVHAVQLDGQQPYKSAKVLSLTRAEAGPVKPQDALDLRQYHGYYSLQVAVYNPDFGTDFRAAAEQAAKALREEGDQAFYYHGPRMSLVTVGLFTDDDFVEHRGVRGYGPRVLELQRRYAHNLVNGRTYLVRRAGDAQGTAQPSFLVPVP